MKLSYQGIKKRDEWAALNITLPSYDPEHIAELTRKEPVWVHFGIGNIFRVFLGGIADRLIEEGAMERGITCAETFDYDIVDRIYAPHDNLALSVILDGDGGRERHVIGSLSESIRAEAADTAAMERLREVFCDPALQMVSFTITEKGYALRAPDGTYLPVVQKDLDGGPETASGVMGIVTAMLYARYRSCGAPIALVSMDNVSRNGEKLKSSVTETARCWVRKGLADKGLLEYVEDGKSVTFPWTMIDKITPRPRPDIAEDLAAAGIEGMEILVTSRQTYIAPFVNAERPQYLVVEDDFPNGRPPLERAGVYMTDRDTVNRSERMKVTACLNPIHTALCTFACMFGHTLFSDAMKDPDLRHLADRVGSAESLPVVTDPGILSPKAFLDEVLNDRFPNPYLGDTSARIAVDISQMVGIRFGETIKAYIEREGSAARLKGIPLAIAGWFRYLLGVDDAGAVMERSPDPLLPRLTEQLEGMRFGDPDSLKDQLRWILSNETFFGTNLYAAGIGERIEELVRRMLAGPGAVRQTLQAELASV